MCDLQDEVGQARCSDRVDVGLGFFLVVELAEQPADGADGGAQEALGGEVCPDARGADTDVDRIPVRYGRAEMRFGLG